MFVEKLNWSAVLCVWVDKLKTVLLYYYLPLGLQSIRSRMERVCKCHGMSGSCSMRVCWRKLPQFRRVGDALTSAYEGASHVRLAENRRRRSKKLRAANRDFKKPNKTDLVYLEDSPDYCERNET